MLTMNEDDIIKVMKSISKFPLNSLLSPYDDAWSFKIGNTYLTVTTDMLVESTDVPKGMKPEHVGRKAITSAVSDLSSKGVKPKYYLISLGLNHDFGTKNVKALAKGFSNAIKEYGGTIIAGDTNQSNDMSINVVAIGLSENPPIPRRLGRPGDVVAVTGTFGEAAAGLKIILRRVKYNVSRNRFTEAFLKPIAKVHEGVALAKANVLMASIDSSDGLSMSLYNLSEARAHGNLGIRLDHLPYSEPLNQFCINNNLNLIDLVLCGGEEYELVTVVKKRSWKYAQEIVENVGGKLIRIGEIVSRPGVWMTINGKYKKVKRGGWRHFLKS